MKNLMKTVRPTRTRSYLKHKLVSAGIMLLVSSILMVSTSYAWFVLSTAPEVSNIKTQVGANGALEIALMDANSWADLSLLDMGDIDESATGENPVSAAVANLTWGNLVDLDDSGYGLDKIVLNPARLYIEQDGSGYKVNSVMLKTPVYGEDGRVKSLDKTSAVAYSYANNTFSNADGYGVRAIGTSATMSAFQLGMNAARSTIVTYASAARTNASNALNSTGGALANVVVAYALTNQDDGFKNTDVAQVKKLAEGMQDSLGEIENAMRQAFAGYITTAGAVYDEENNPDGVITAENYQTKLAEITNTGEGKKALSELLTAYPGISTVIPEIGTYITKLTSNQTKVEEAIASCDALTDDDHTWAEISGIITPLMNTNDMLVNNKTIETLKKELRKEDGSLNEGAALSLVQGGVSITVPSGSGLLSDIADFAGDYTANVQVYPVVTVGSITLDGTVGMGAVMTTATEANPIYLTACSNGLKGAELAEAAGSNSITDYYGYAIDLAFRTNATESDLLLQTEPANRIYDGDTQNAALQGGGSYMSFTTTAGLSATKMVKLMSGIRVVLMDRDQQILAIAALDTTLGKDVYTAEIVNGTETGYYYLDGSAGAYQNSDLITTEQYNRLPDESNVTFNKTTGKVTAKLYIYGYEMTKSTTVDASGNTVVRMEGEGENAKPLYTGGLTLGSQSTSGVITALTQDVVQQVTALVYLDGSVVNNSTVAANSMHSMTGTLNLQFSSSAELLPAENNKLRTDGSAVEYTLMEGELYEAGFLYYGNTLCKVNDGYAIYTGSDDKIYFATTGGSEYTELTAANAASVLTVVTASLTPATASITGTGTTTLTVALNVTDDDLEFTGWGLLPETANSETYVDVAVGGDGIFTLTGKSAGSVTYHATVDVKIGSWEFTFTTGQATVTVS